MRRADSAEDLHQCGQAHMLPRVTDEHRSVPATNSAAARHRRHLLWRIHRHYQTVSRIIKVVDHEYLFTRIADPDRVLDEVAAEEDRRDKAAGYRRDGQQLHLPYWAELWDSALGMGQFLIKHGATRYGQPNTLDLGCGMGFAGMIASSLGWPVLFADLEPPALLFARLNSVEQSNIRTRRLNWQTDRLEERFNLILGADILYERIQWEHLHRFWQHHLAEGGVILLGEPGRQTGDMFIDWVKSNGWSLTEHEEPVTTRVRPIRLFELRKM